MDASDRKILNENLEKLSLNCNFENVYGFLKVKKVFTSKQMQHYDSVSFQTKPEESKCQELLRDIQARGPDAFAHLLECFKVTGHAMQHEILKKHKASPESQQLRVRMSTSFPSCSPEAVYKMTSSPRGYYIFINNIDFDHGDQRSGAQNDKKFAEVLEDMGYKGEYYENKTKEEIRTLLYNFSTKEALAKVDSCIVAISSHGKLSALGDYYIDGTDDSNESNALLCSEVISYFNTEACKLPRGKPKVFLLQVCRGDAVIDNMGDFENLPTTVRETHHKWYDTFILYPSHEGFRANRNPKYGSWLFLAATDVFADHAHNKSLLEMVDLISDLFDEYYRESLYRQQTLNFNTHGVDKLLYFNPGLFEPYDTPQQL